ncbi:MAG: beta-propeller domain-containing protein, partial [Tenericutes bacterium]|nr:beta-propeller domain-containing protein [Mycoplasmatota bacterium]
MKGIKKFLTLILFGFFAITLVACGTTPIEGTPTGENFGSFGTYDNLKEYLLDYYEDEDNYYYSAEGAPTTTAMAGADVASQDETTAETRDYSKTNNQVDGVQESDRILTDGYKIYILSGNKFFIVDADTLNIDYEF